MGGNNNSVEQDEDLPTYVVIIIGVICAAIVIALTIVLVILCYKRRQSIKKYQEQNSKPPTNTVLPPQNQAPIQQPTQPNGEAKQLKSAMKAYDNPNLENHSPNYEDRKSPIFATQTSQGPDNYDYYQKQQNGNGFVPNGGPNYSYENQNNIHRERSFKSSNANRDSTDGNSFPMNPPSRNNSSAEKPYLYLEDPYRLPPSHNNSGEGSMGSDQNKPKKVMYEVVV